MQLVRVIYWRWIGIGWLRANQMFLYWNFLQWNNLSFPCWRYVFAYLTIFFVKCSTDLFLTAKSSLADARTFTSIGSFLLHFFLMTTPPSIWMLFTICSCLCPSSVSSTTEASRVYSSCALPFPLEPVGKGVRCVTSLRSVLSMPVSSCCAAGNPPHTFHKAHSTVKPHIHVHFGAPNQRPPFP